MFGEETRAKIIKYYSIILLAIIYLPLAMIMLFSFDSQSDVGFPLGDFPSLRWWRMFFTDPSAYMPIVHSLSVAAAVGAISVVIGLLAAWALNRHVFRGKKAFQYQLIAPMSLPYILIGVGLLAFFRHAFDINLSLLTLIIGHTLIAIPYTTLIIWARLIGFDKSLEEAAQDLGADRLTSFRKITLPLIAPGVFVSLFVSFTISLEDVVLAHFLTGNRSTVPVFIYSMLRRATGLKMGVTLSAFMVVIAAVLITFFGIKGGMQTSE